MFVVTLPSSAGNNPRSFALEAKKEGADVLEIRSDLTPTVPAFVSPLPILYSMRRDHGGPLLEQKLHTQQQRPSVGAVLKNFHADYLDIDSDTQNFLSLCKDCPKKAKLILSYHNYEKTPSLSELQERVLSMLACKPWAFKIATEVVTYDDLLVLDALQSWLRKKKVRSIVLGMGEKAHCSRVLSPFRNVMTFASLDGYESSAVGQLPLSFYRLLLRVGTPALMNGKKTPKIFGIIGGKQILSSLSPVIHNALFQKHKIDALYSCFPTEHFKRTMKTLRKLGLTGLSVTAPFKTDAFQIAKKHDVVVDELGVANTLVRSPFPPRGKGLGMGEGEAGWKAFNTDVAGIEHGYPELCKANSVAILGAGGVVPSVIFAVRHCNPEARITVFARDKKKASHALKKFHVSIEPLGSVISCKADAVLCTVSQDVSLPLPSPVSKSSIAIDLRYGKTTSFMNDAKKQGYCVRDGTAMLIAQAIKQFEYFTGKKSSAKDALMLRMKISRLSAGRSAHQSAGQ